MKFYKGVLEEDLKKSSYIPGTVTTSMMEALMWKERIESNKKKGAAKHVRHGKSVIIEIEYHGELLECDEFQRAGVKEHNRSNCWLSTAKDKAQINTPVTFKILGLLEIESNLWSKK